MRFPLASAAAVAVALCAIGGVRPASAATDGMGLYVGTTALPWVESEVEVDVALGLARGEVRQAFRNTTGKVAEAVYVFPLPTGAAVTAMTITVAGKPIAAAIAPRADAVARYEAAIAGGKAAALTERERPGVYTQSIAGIPGDGVVEVRLTWQARLERHAGLWELAHPMVVGPRYVPGRATGAPTRGAGWSPDTERAPDASRVTPPVGAGARTPYGFTVRLAGATAIASPTHELEVTAHDRGVVAQVRDARGDRELVVRWRSAAERAVRAVAEPAGQGGYVAVLIEAAPEAARPRRAARTWLVAIDRAGSLAGVGAAQDRRVAEAVLDQMRDDDRFALVAIGQAPRFARANRAERTRALAALERAGGTDDLTAGLAATLAGVTAAPATSVVLVTDGLVADDAAAIARAAAAGVPIHPVGVGAAPNRWLLEAIAARTGGVAHVLASADEAAAVAAEVVAADQAAAVSVDWRKPSVEDAEPARAVVVPGGATLIVAVDRKAVPAGEVEVAIGATRLRATIEPAAGGAGPALATEWARLRVARLWAAGDVKAATALAVERGVIGPTTALVAVAPTAGDKVSSTVTVAVPAPAGVRHEARRRSGDDRGEVDGDTVIDSTGTAPVASGVAPADEPAGAGAGVGGEAATEDEERAPRSAPAPAIDEANYRGEAIALSGSATVERSLAGRPLGRRWLSVGVDLGARLDDPTPAASLAVAAHYRATPRLAPALRLDLSAAPAADEPVAVSAALGLGVRAFDRLVFDLGAGLGWAGDLGLAYRAGLTFDAGRFGVGLHLTGVRAPDEAPTTVGAGLEARF